MNWNENFKYTKYIYSDQSHTIFIVRVCDKKFHLEHQTFLCGEGGGGGGDEHLGKKVL